ncbi:lipid IV(A) 3-deoxy-D-manno-octulosonic acid transferase [Methylotenera sp. N17]|uniref:lipid IV(A) 3-deoxy-D-manno-octulosonic acid transferase n=1 Tax=Methylotenera sp. N17 TaxID=1502761 RepID=UPI0006492426|nr:lipid IV(A) 3-deoxy-D-manno-octulosonic acid transferase [Methylotenera sp. N17]
MPHALYTLLLYLALPFVPLKLLWRGIKQPEYLQHWAERFGFYSTQSRKPIIWIHCVSVGETRAAAPLVNILLTQYPQYQLLLTHTTPTGRATSEQLFGDHILRVYLPYDVPFAVNRFVKHFKPKLGLIMETELWFNLIDACDRHQVPQLLLNARLSEKSAKGYVQLGRLVQNGLSKFALIAAQSNEDEARFKLLGAPHTMVAGNLKFDVTAPAESEVLGQQLRALFGNTRTVFVAASTREGEEPLILDAIANLPLLTVIVPRHPQRFDEVEQLLKSRHIPYIRRSQLTTTLTEDIQVVLGDSMGELYTYYAASDFAFIGGSLLKYGGQNLIEAASMGKPILIGKYTYNFAEATKGAVQSGAATQVRDVDNLRAKIQFLIDNPSKREKMGLAALDFSKASTGTTVRMMHLIGQYLQSTDTST